MAAPTSTSGLSLITGGIPVKRGRFSGINSVQIPLSGRARRGEEEKRRRGEGELILFEGLHVANSLLLFFFYDLL
jgi:hypothetical protein